MPSNQVEKLFRYPGARPFSFGQQDIFFGREKDIRDFYRLIKVEKLVVLNSKSGMGKSSLLNAGVLPRIHKDEQLLPISIRFGAYTEEKEENPLEICRQMIEIETENKHPLHKILPEENSLWAHLKQRWFQTKKRKGFLLVFDQFEELFTYPKDVIEAFKIELVEALNTDIPHHIRQLLAEKMQEQPGFLSEEELELLHTPFQIKVVMAIRSDRMSLMTQMADYLPNILSNCYELGALNPEQAEDAILNPAFKNDEVFASPPFDYRDDLIEKILAFLTEDNTQKIESFQLQILCQYIERKVIEKELKVVKIADIGEISGIYKNYYDDQIALLGSAEDQHLARLLIEDGLIFEEEERRLNMYEGQIYKSFGLSPALLGKLVNTHLLRAEPSMKGGYTYELSHDTLVAPILRAKQVRKTKEAQLAAQEAEAEHNREIEALRQQANEERAKRRQYRLFAILGFLLFFLALGASLIAYSSYQEAEKQREQAQQNLDLLNSAQKEKALARYNEYLAKGKAYMNESQYQDAIQEFNTALAFNANGQEAIKLEAESQKKYDTKLIFEQYINEGDSLFSLGADRYIDALEKYRKADELEYDEKLTDKKISHLTARLEGAFVQFEKEGDIFYKANGYRFALKRYQEAQRIKPNDKELRQKIAVCKKQL